MMRLAKVALPVLGFAVGFTLVVGVRVPIAVPYDYASYLSLATLAGLDSIMGGIRAGLEGKFRNDIFLSGFIVNMVVAVLLAALGDQIGVEGLYLAAVVTLGGRIFWNLSVIRRHLLDRRVVRGQK
jgi:small basic protein